MRIDEIKINYTGTRNERGEVCTVVLTDVSKDELEDLKKKSKYF